MILRLRVVEGGLLNKFGSLGAALQFAYPDLNWDVLALRSSPKILYHRDSKVLKSWKTPEVVRDYFESIKSKLHISHYTDWYRISRTQIMELGGAYSFVDD